MPKCASCQQQWTWKETLKKTASLNPTLICSYCNEKQYQTQKSKTIGSVFVFIILLPLLLQAFFEMLGIILFGLYFILLGLTILSYPFIVELSSEEKYINFFKNK